MRCNKLKEAEVMGHFFIYLFVVAIAIVFSRLNTMYHPELIVKKYVTVKNRKLSKLLIANTNPDFLKNKDSKSYTDRLLVPGVVFLSLSAIFSTGVFVSFVLKNEYQQFFFDFLLAITFFASGFNSFNISRYKIQIAKNTKSAIFVRVLCVCGWVIAGVLLIIAAFVSLR